MKNKTHIGFVDAHAKGDCRGHDQIWLCDETVLTRRAFGFFQPCMISRGVNTIKL